MASFRTTHHTMKLIVLLLQLSLVLQTHAQEIPEECIGATAPRDSDITVTCGTEFMDVAIEMCPMYAINFNESLMVLNSMGHDSQCYGTADWSVEPAVLRFHLPVDVNDPLSCGTTYELDEQAGEGPYSHFSSVQYANLSGVVHSIDPAITITYRPVVQYWFSCYYPLTYIVGDREAIVGGTELAVEYQNGSFISTLTMHLYSDADLTTEIVFDSAGVAIKTLIYVQVKATNLTDKFHVLLDQCYATAIIEGNDTIQHEMFVGCVTHQQTTMINNANGHNATFMFEAFRFVIHRDLVVSSFILHCITRLCSVEQCPLLWNCEDQGFDNAGDEDLRRKKRSTDDLPEAVVTSDKISVHGVEDNVGHPAQNAAASKSHYSSPVVAVIICIVVLSILLVAMGAYVIFYMRKKH